MDTFNVIAGIVTIIALIINVIQWLWSRNIKQQDFQDIEADYSSLHQVIIHCDKALDVTGLPTEAESNLQYARGLVDTLRMQFITRCRRRHKQQPDLVKPWAYKGNYTFPEDKKKVDK